MDSAQYGGVFYVTESQCWGGCVNEAGLGLAQREGVLEKCGLEVT